MMIEIPNSSVEDAVREERYVAKAMAGDRQAFDWLIKKYECRLDLLFRNMRLQDREDLVQETIISAWKNIEHYTYGSNFYCWLVKIASNKRRDKFRHDCSGPGKIEGAMSLDEDIAVPDHLSNIIGKLGQHEVIDLFNYHLKDHERTMFGITSISRGHLFGRVPFLHRERYVTISLPCFLARLPV